MWTCPKCRQRVDDSFEVCWSCGTTEDGVEDPDFVVADEAEPIPDEPTAEGAKLDDPFADFPDETPFPEIVECYTADSAVEAKFIADQLNAEGVPAVADRVDVNMALGGFQPQMWGCGPRIRVRKQDLPRAQAWLEAYVQHRNQRRAER